MPADRADDVEGFAGLGVGAFHEREFAVCGGVQQRPEVGAGMIGNGGERKGRGRWSGHGKVRRCHDGTSRRAGMGMNRNKRALSLALPIQTLPVPLRLSGGPFSRTGGRRP